MELDETTLRVTFGTVILGLAALFYFAAYRPTRSPYSGWWCLALLFFLLGSSLYLLDGTPHQIWANPVGNALLVQGGVAVWAGARSLRTEKFPAWALLGLPLLTLIAAAVDDPAVNPWAGGEALLASMAVAIGISSWEVWRLDPGYTRLKVPLSLSSAALAIFYLLRLGALVVDGQHGHFFTTVFGSAFTTMITLALLVMVSFTMAALSSEQQNRALSAEISRDDLTGLLNRNAFLELAAVELGPQASRARHGALIMADLDHFKAVNDTFGHGAGDLALKNFADACLETVRTTDLVSRFGGEEFVLLIPGASPERAEAIAQHISTRLAASSTAGDMPMPTASYGITTYDAGTTDIEAVITAADTAMYLAKAQGRNRVAHSD